MHHCLSGRNPRAITRVRRRRKIQSRYVSRSRLHVVIRDAILTGLSLSLSLSLLARNHDARRYSGLDHPSREGRIRDRN